MLMKMGGGMGNPRRPGVGSDCSQVLEQVPEGLVVDLVVVLDL